MVQLRYLNAAVLLVAVVLSCSQAYADNGTRALELLPRNTSMVGVWNLSRSRLTPLGNGLLDAVADSRRLGPVPKLRARAKIDWKRDIDTVIMAMLGNFKVGQPFDIVLMQGRFAEDQLVAAAKDAFRRVIPRQYRGVIYYELGKNAEMAVVQSYWVTTRKGTMRRVIDVANGIAPSAKRQKTLAQILKVGDVTKDVWCAAVVPTAMREDIAAEAGGYTIERFMASLDLRKKAIARVRLGLSDRTAVVALGMFLRAQAMQDSELAQIGLASALRTMTTSRNNNNLDLTLRIPNGDVSKLEQFLLTQ